MAASNDKEIVVKALGRQVSLGMLYDMHRDIILTKSLWKHKTLKKSIIKDKAQPDVKISTVTDDSFDNKANALDVSASLKVSVLAGLVDVKASGRYLKDTKSSSKTERLSLIYKRHTHLERLKPDLCKRGTADLITGASDLGGATHVITGIEYGNNVVFMFEDTVSSKSDQSKIEGNLAASIKTLSWSVDGEGNLNVNETADSRSHTCSVKYFGDVLLDKNPSTLAEAIAVFKQLPGKLDAKHPARPVTMMLQPIQSFMGGVNVLAQPIEESAIQEAIERLAYLDSVAAKITSMEKIQSVLTLVPELQSSVMEFKKMFRRYHNKFKSKLAALLPPIRAGEKDVHELYTLSEDDDSSPFCENNLDAFIQHLQLVAEILKTYVSCAELDNSHVFTNEVRLQAKLIQKKFYDKTSMVICLQIQSVADDPLVKAMRAYLDNKPVDEKTMDKIVAKNQNRFDIAEGVAYKFHAVRKVVEYNDLAMFLAITVTKKQKKSKPRRPKKPPLPPGWEKRQDSDDETFYEHTESGFNTYERPKAAASAAPTSSTDSTLDACIQVWQGGKLKYRNLNIPEQVIELNQATVPGPDYAFLQWKLPEGETIENFQASKAIRFFAEHRMEGSSGRWKRTPTNEITDLWVKISDLPSLTCLEVRVACQFDWGVGPASDILHIKTTTARKSEYNLLVLGETGVGKSTFINSFCNYLTYPSLEIAKQNKMISMLPAHFEVQDKNNERKEIKVGDSSPKAKKQEMDNALEGSSVTQYPKSYPFQLSTADGTKYTLNIIDTPGIGDTRGESIDFQNFENILEHLKYYTFLHGVLILLKPNQARLTMSFRYCVKELLKRLSKDARHNIMFVFTNARSTFYQPGDTFPALRCMLDQVRKANGVEISLANDNIFCLDSESFRYQCILHCGVQLANTADLERDFSVSWDRSVETCRRLLTAIKSRPELDLDDIQEIQKARELIYSISTPLAKIQDMVQLNINHIENTERAIKAAGSNMRKLQGLLKTSVKRVQNVPTSKPRTVCTKCAETVEAAGTGVKVKRYTTCHNICYIQGIPEKAMGDALLLKCYAFNWSCSNGMCRTCGCHYSVHTHIMYDLEIVDEMVPNQSKVDEFQKAKTSKDAAEVLLKENKQEKKEWEEENKVITDACAQFAYFLKEKAIVPCNDELDNYMSMQLKHYSDLYTTAKDPLQKDRYDRKIATLKANRDKYKASQQVLKQKIDKAEKMGKTDAINPKQIQKLRSKLLGLKKCGPQLKNVLKAVDGVPPKRAEMAHNFARKFIPKPFCSPVSSRNKKNKKRGKRGGKGGFFGFQFW